MDIARVLVVEDDPDACRATIRTLATSQVEVADCAARVFERLAGGDAEWDVVVLDLGLPDMAGLDVLHRLRESGSLASIVVVTGDATAQMATECMRAGAFYYLTKPFRPVTLAETVESAVRYARMRKRLARVPGASTEELLVGASPVMRKLRAAVTRLAAEDVSVLIRGESGTGKELVARALHERGSRRDKPFVAVNCGAIPEQLIDSELFGHTRGAFTGAMTDRPGLFVEADGGTLFLDEIGDMPQSVQARLLRVLQESEVRPVGGSGTRSVDVRVIAATHVDLATAVEAGKFRRDLFYRLNVVTIEVPPLRERLDDLPLLVAHIVRKHAAHTTVAPTALERLAGYTWPGNVRELENALMHAIAFHHGDEITAEDLPAFAIGSQPLVVIPEAGLDDDVLPLSEARRQAVVEHEQKYLIKLMERTRGSIADAARIARLDRQNLRRMLARHKIDPEKFK